VAIVGPQGSGKTTLLESLLWVTGAISRKGSHAQQNTIGDASAEARERMISVDITPATVGYLGDTFTFLDCPGSIEFLQETLNALAGVDAAIVVTEPDPAKAAINATVATAYHELGHAVISIYDLPATGRLEDAADQLSAYMWLVPDDNIKNDAPEVVKDFAEMFKRYSANRRDLINDDFAAEHSLDLTRMYNLACWVYGSNPAANADIVAQVGLPQSRVDRCQFEFDAIEKAWRKLLAPYVM
jgi:hypothetical protein